MAVASFLKHLTSLGIRRQSHFCQCSCSSNLNSFWPFSFSSRHFAVSSSLSAKKSMVQKSNLDVQLENFYEESEKHEDYFDVHKLVSLEECFKARMHLGHKRDLWHEAFRQYLYGTRIDVDIIDLDATVPRLKRALNVIAHMAFRNGIILFVCREGFREAHYVDELAVELGEFSHTRRWKRGQMASKAAAWSSSVRKPDLIVMFCCHDSIFAQHEAIREAANLGIATVGLVDSNCDPRLVSYPVPANDDSPSSVRHFGSLVSQAVMAGKQKRVSVLNGLGIPTTMEDLWSYKKEDVYSGREEKRVSELYQSSSNTNSSSNGNSLSMMTSDPSPDCGVDHKV